MIYFFILFVLFSVNANAKDIYIRDDGGIPVTECDGSADKAKSADKKCAYRTYYSDVKVTTASSDNIVVRRGSYSISIKASSTYVTTQQYAISPDKYKDLVKKGNRVFIDQSFELVLKK